MAEDVRKIKAALLGDGEFGQKGLIEILKEHSSQLKTLSRRQQQLENWRWYVLGACAAVCTLLPFVLK
jgi:hypothetical protein